MIFIGNGLVSKVNLLNFEVDTFNYLNVGLGLGTPVLFDVHTIGVVTSIKESNISGMQQMEQDNFNFLCTTDFCFLEVSVGI